MGTSKYLSLKTYQFQDHPHAYGDKCGYVSLHFVAERIIPTRMGTSTEDKGKVWTVEDHPHAYGDKFAAVASFHSNSGSSPRVWGQDLDS